MIFKNKINGKIEEYIRDLYYLENQTEDDNIREAINEEIDLLR